MVKKIILIGLIPLLFSSCGMRTQVLNYGYRVPYAGYKFENIKYFSLAVFEGIDIDYFYEEIDFYESDQNFNKRFDSEYESQGSLQFYPSGHIRFLSLNRFDPDPQKAGWSGIIYKRGLNLRIDEQGLDSSFDLNIYTKKVKVEGDLIYILETKFLIFDTGTASCFVYKKAGKIPDEWKHYKPDW